MTIGILLRDYQTALINETRAAFAAGSKHPLVVLGCGGGKTACFAFMAETAQSRGWTVWFLVHRRELLEQTTETFDRFGIVRKSIFIGMVATVANHPERYPKPDLIVFDEAHFSSAATWQKIINLYPDALIIGLTATPCRLDGKPLGATYDKLIIGRSASQLIQDGYLSPYRYFAPSVTDLSALKRKGADFDAESAAELLGTRAVFGDVIKHWRELANGLQTICYCATIKHSEKMAEEFRKQGINAVHFDGNTPDKERKEIVTRFRKGEIKILCNVDLISVGFDCPDCECCILLRPTMSTALFIQQSCRALRPKQGKTAIILDHVNNYQRHGLPDDEREWSLSEPVKTKSQFNADGTLQIRQCPKCYFTYKAAPACPNCGYKTELTEREIKNIREIKLAEIKERRREIATQAVAKKATIDECWSLSEIMAWCKANGKKAGYGYYVAKGRGLMK